MRLCASLLLMFTCLLPGLASARVEERSSLPSIHELPASTAHWPQESPILSGIEWTAISPPGTVLLPIEDEPYIQNQGGWHKGLPWIDQGLSSIRLVSHMPDGGFYNAVASLRMDPQKGDANRLRHSFDNAAHSMVRLAQVAREERTQLGYRVTEMRSPLGLADPRDKENCAREYIAYQAELVNPLARPRPEGEVLYSIVNGELRVLRIVDGRHYLLTVEFDSQDYPWAINTTCNIARLVLERFADCDEGMCIPGMLDYETEWYWPVVEEAQLAQADEAVADLLEQPDSGLHPGHFADRLAGEEEPALRSLPQRRHPSLPPGEVLLELDDEDGLVEVQPQPDWAEVPYERHKPESELPGAASPLEPVNPLDGWLDDSDTDEPAPDKPIEDGLDGDAESQADTEDTDDSHEPVEDAVARVATDAPQEEHSEPRMPRLFEGWGSPRNRDIPANPGLLDPFAGWLGRDTGSIISDVARRLQRREQRGR